MNIVAVGAVDAQRNWSPPGAGDRLPPTSSDALTRVHFNNFSVGDLDTFVRGLGGTKQVVEIVVKLPFLTFRAFHFCETLGGTLPFKVCVAIFCKNGWRKFTCRRPVYDKVHPNVLRASFVATEDAVGAKWDFRYIAIYTNFAKYAMVPQAVPAGGDAFVKGTQSCSSIPLCSAYRCKGRSDNKRLGDKKHAVLPISSHFVDRGYIHSIGNYAGFGFNLPNDGNLFKMCHHLDGPSCGCPWHDDVGGMFHRFGYASGHVANTNSGVFVLGMREVGPKWEILDDEWGQLAYSMLLKYNVPVNPFRNAAGNYVVMDTEKVYDLIDTEDFLLFDCLDTEVYVVSNDPDYGDCELDCPLMARKSADDDLAALRKSAVMELPSAGMLHCFDS